MTTSRGPTVSPLYRKKKKKSSKNLDRSVKMFVRFFPIFFFNLYYMLLFFPPSPLCPSFLLRVCVACSFFFDCI